MGGFCAFSVYIHLRRCRQNGKNEQKSSKLRSVCRNGSDFSGLAPFHAVNERFVAIVRH